MISKNTRAISPIPTFIVQRALVLGQVVHWLLDYDDTMAPTEDTAFRGCCKVVNHMLQAHRVQKTFKPKELQKRFVGRSFRHIAIELATEFGFTFAAGELDALVAREQDSVIEALGQELQPAPGVNDFLATTAAHGVIHSVVSSSASERLYACLDATGQNLYVPRERVFSAASSLPTPCSKPDPAIYLHAMARLGASPENSLAIEDSLSGLKSALGAGLNCLGYVGCLPPEERQGRTDLLLREGAMGVMTDWKHLTVAA